MGNQSNLCSLCLCTIWDKTFEEVDDTIKEISDIIFASKNLSLTKGQPICYTCSGKIKDSFNFKSMCIYTEDFLAPCLSAEGISQFNLKEAHMRKFGGKITDIINNDSVCRLCLQWTKGNLASFLDLTEHDMMQKCIPEITIQRTLNPIVCYPCVRSLHNYAAFISDCLSVQDKKIRYHENKEICLDDNKLSKDEHLKTKCETQEQSDLNLNVIGKGLMNGIDFNFKRGENCVGSCQQFYQSSSWHSIARQEKPPKRADAQPPDTSIPFPTYGGANNHPHAVEIEDDGKPSTLYDLDLHTVRQTELDLKPDEVDNGRGAPKRRKPRSKTKTHTCEQCGYQTTYLNALKSHRLNHMEAADVDMYTCGKCEYKTKYRNALKSHELNHKLPSEINMRKCDECPYETKHRTALVLHMLKHKRPEEIQMYRCDRCDFQTKFKHALKPHKLKHKGGT